MVQKGSIVSCIDLHGHIAARVTSDASWATLADKKAFHAFVAEIVASDAYERYEGVELSVAWNEIGPKLPPLEPPLLERRTPTVLTFATKKPRGRKTYVGKFIEFGVVGRRRRREIDIK